MLDESLKTGLHEDFIKKDESESSGCDIVLEKGWQSKNKVKQNGKERFG